jgi:hypothetical protein
VIELAKVAVHVRHSIDAVEYTHRWSAETGLIHSYPRADLANEAISYLVPRCNADTMYPIRHARVELSCAATSTGDRFTWCQGCAAAARRGRLDQRVSRQRIR